MCGTMMDPVAGLILCSPGMRPVDLSIINGRIVVEQGQITTINLKVQSLDIAAACSMLLLGRLKEDWKADVLSR